MHELLDGDAMLESYSGRSTKLLNIIDRASIHSTEST